MKFIHIADIHFDKPFTVLERNGLSEARRLEQRQIFNKAIEYIKENNIEYLFITGDLYEHEYVRRSTIEYINDCFKQIENTSIYITPGNHDPYIKNSYYNKFNWNKNVKIFTKLEKIEKDNINIYGYGFTDFYSKQIELPENLDENKLNILLMHSDLNGANKEIGEYNPILETTLTNSKFNYVALGHIHKKNTDNLKAVYPGSLIAGGFDELEKHGMIEGNINENTKEILINFIPIDTKEFVKEELDITSIYSEEALIEKINQLSRQNNKYYEYLLCGNKNIEIDINRILKYIEDKQVIKLKDISKTQYDIEKISKEKSLKGIFVKELLGQINEDNSNKEEILRIIEIGLNAIYKNKKEVN